MCITEVQHPPVGLPKTIRAQRDGSAPPAILTHLRHLARPSVDLVRARARGRKRAQKGTRLSPRSLKETAVIPSGRTSLGFGGTLYVRLLLRLSPWSGRKPSPLRSLERDRSLHVALPCVPRNPIVPVGKREIGLIHSHSVRTGLEIIAGRPPPPPNVRFPIYRRSDVVPNTLPIRIRIIIPV